MEEACTFIVSNFLRCKGRNNIVKCKNILLLNKTVRKVLFRGVCKTPVHNTLQKRLIIKVWGCPKSFFWGAFIIGVCNEYLQWAFIMGVCKTPVHSIP